MLSTFPATGFPESSSLGNPFPPFETGFPPWDTHEPPFLFLPTLEDNEPFIFNPNPSQEPVTSNSGSNKSKPASRVSNRKKPENPSFGSHETTSCLDTIIDERKRKRMISNRESARRSRKRKQKHLEDMMSQSNRLSVENRELMNRLRLVVHEDRLVRRENELLELEHMMLRQRLWDISQVLIVRHNMNTSAWPCNNFTSINDGQLSNHGYSLIT